MHIIDFYPSQGTFSPREVVRFFIEVAASAPQKVECTISIRHLNKHPINVEEVFELLSGEQTLQMQWMPPAMPAGYSVRLEVRTINDVFYATTAFDVLSSWTSFPRYGFLTDFNVSRMDPKLTLKQLTRFHINGLQFYDWQYRHDQLLSPTEDYIDPLGREISLVTIRTLVNTAHEYGMAAMPYLAIYAASADFWRAHPDWALYNKEGTAIPFGENFLGIMNPSVNGAWSEHLLAESARVLQETPFDGLHIDQYGEPKQAWDVNQNPVDLPRAFVDFIRSASNQHPGKTILFNAVGNWPIEALCESDVDFMYIEIWPPDVKYHHIAQIVLNAVKLSHGKPVVIAHYLPANRPFNNLLADAVILACGGTRIELGEDARLLSDPYFPKHEALPQELYFAFRRLADFAVRNGEWLTSYTLLDDDKATWSKGGMNSNIVSTDQNLMTVMRNHPEKIVLSVVNFSGLGLEQCWDEEHSAPKPLQNVSVSIQMAKQPSQLFWDSPESEDGPQELQFKYINGSLEFQIPQIKFIGLVAIHE